MKAVVVQQYDIHIYFDNQTREEAVQLYQLAKQKFPNQRYLWSDKPIGPHPLPMFEIDFIASEMHEIIPWIMQTHGNLAVLIHPHTGDEFLDHTHHAMWLGTPVRLNTEIFKN